MRRIKLQVMSNPSGWTAVTQLFITPLLALTASWLVLRAEEVKPKRDSRKEENTTGIVQSDGAKGAARGLGGQRRLVSGITLTWVPPGEFQADHTGYRLERPG